METENSEKTPPVSRCTKKLSPAGEQRPPLHKLLAGFSGLLPEEPFRIFFPLGILAGLVAVALWPLFYSGWLGDALPHPATMHARIMIQGWFGAFVFGFLGTAGPRMLTAPRLAGPEAGVLLALWAGAVFFHLQNQPVTGDFFFLLALGLFSVLLLFRGLVRQDVPPPAFALVLLGILSGLVGTAILIVDGSMILHPTWGRVAKLLLYQCFLLFPILGVGVFLFPRFLGLPSGPDYDESPTPPPGWLDAAGRATLFGLLILGSFLLEAIGQPRWGAGLRAVLLLCYLLFFVPIFPWKRGRGTLTNILRLGMISLPVGYAAIAIWPGYVIAMEHIVFIGGFGLITMAVGSRVVLGHSGKRPSGKTCDNVMRSALAFILLALITRVSADFLPNVLISHHVYAAICWIGGIALWMVHIIPNVLIPDPSD